MAPKSTNVTPVPLPEAAAGPAKPAKGAKAKAPDNPATVPAVQGAVSVRDARSGLLIPRVTLICERGTHLTTDLEGRGTLPLNEAHGRWLVAKNGFEPLELPALSFTAANGHGPSATIELVPSDGHQGGGLPIFFHEHSPRRSRPDAIESISVHGEFCNWRGDINNLARHPWAPGLWAMRLPMPAYITSTDVRYRLNKSWGEDDPDSEMTARGVGATSYIRRRVLTEPELLFTSPRPGSMSGLGDVAIEVRWAAAGVVDHVAENGAPQWCAAYDGGIDIGSLSLDLNGHPAPLHRIQVSADGAQITAVIQLPTRGEYSITLTARDMAGRPAIGLTSVFATTSEENLVLGDQWIGPATSGHPDPPEWLRDAIFYQVHTRVFAFPSDGHGRPTGPGTFRGVLEKLPYLRALGVNALQFMPLFDGPSNHGYVSDCMFRVERDFGTNADFRKMVRAAHEHGLRVVLDFSDTATQTSHPLFQRAVLEPHHPLRPFIRWASDTEYSSYTIHKDTRNGPWPQFDFAEPRAREYMAELMAYWVREFGVDGFRLDSVERVKPFPSHDWWRILRARIKSENPDALLYGELYGESAPFFDDQLDMAYDVRFNDALRDALKFDNAAGLAALMEESYKADPSGKRALRFLSNHDDDRMLTLLGNEERVRQAFTIIMTSPGIPFIYYGEELGMAGEGLRGANSNRQPMEWDRAGGAMHRLVHDLVKLRKERPWLGNHGALTAIGIEGETGALPKAAHAPASPEAAAPGPTAAHAPSGPCQPFLAYLRRGEKPEQLALVVANLSNEPRDVPLTKDALATLAKTKHWVDTMAFTESPRAQWDADQPLRVAARGIRVLEPAK